MYKGRKIIDPYSVDCSGFQSLKQRLDRFDDATMRQLAVLRNDQFDVDTDDLENDETPVSLFAELDLDFVDIQTKLETMKSKLVSKPVQDLSLNNVSDKSDEPVEPEKEQV